MIAEERGALRSGGNYHTTETLEAAEAAEENFEDAATEADDLALYMEEAGVNTASAVRYAEGMRREGCNSVEMLRRADEPFLSRLENEDGSRLMATFHSMTIAHHSAEAGATRAAGETVHEPIVSKHGPARACYGFRCPLS